MYRSIKLQFQTADGLRSLQTARKKNSIVTKEQEIVLVLRQHFVVRRLSGRGYLIIVEYACPRG